MEQNDKAYLEYFEQLKAVGVNTDRTIERFGGLTELYIKFLAEFSETERFTEIYAAFENNDYAKAEMCSHKLKGVLGNLGMEALYAEAELVMKEIRSGDFASAVKRLEKIEPNVIEIQNVIKKYGGQF